MVAVRRVASRCDVRSHLKTLVEENHVSVRRFDLGEHSASFEAEVPIGESPALLKSGFPGSCLGIVPGALRHAELEAAAASEIRADAKEVLAMPLLANRLFGGTPTIQRSTASPSMSPGRFASYASSTVISASPIGLNDGSSSARPSGWVI